MIISIYPIEHTAYPEYLSNNGLTEDMLLQLLLNNQIDWTIPETCISAIFFSNLHPFLQKYLKIKVCTKSCIGQLYCEIDPFMAARNSVQTMLSDTLIGLLNNQRVVNPI